LVDFELSCQGKKLKDTQLYATIHYPSQNGTLTTVSVASGPSGQYQISWSLDNKNAWGGEYKINVYRQVDSKRGVTEPFISMPLTHEPTASNPLPVKTEFLVLLFLALCFMWTSYRKMKIQFIRKTLSGKPIIEN